MVDLAAITRARARLAGVHVLTPLLEYDRLNELLGGRVLFKAENLQRTGSFKFRGAYNKIASLAPEERAKGVVTYSSGNHAQGVAAAAKIFGIPATIVMPDDAPAMKQANTIRLGAKLVLYDRINGDRKAIAENISRQTNAVIVPPYDDEMIIAGQGTIGLELLEQADNAGTKPDYVLCPVGGGGLIGGISTAVKELLPECKIYCVEPEGYDDTKRSLAAGRRVSNSGNRATICDAIMTQTPGKLTFPINLRNLAGGLTVSEADVAEAVKILFEAAKLVVEPGAAVGVAALYSRKLDLKGNTAVVILSGGNMDRSTFEAL